MPRARRYETTFRKAESTQSHPSKQSHQPVNYDKHNYSVFFSFYVYTPIHGQEWFTQCREQNWDSILVPRIVLCRVLSSAQTIKPAPFPDRYGVLSSGKIIGDMICHSVPGNLASTPFCSCIVMYQHSPQIHFWDICPCAHAPRRIWTSQKDGNRQNTHSQPSHQMNRDDHSFLLCLLPYPWTGTEWSFHYCPVSSVEHSPKFQVSKAVPFLDRYGVFSSRRSTGNMIYPLSSKKFYFISFYSIIIAACPPEQSPKLQPRKAAPVPENNGHE